MILRPVEFASKGRMSDPIRLLKHMQTGIALLDYRVGCAMQQEQNNMLLNLCEVVVYCQMAINVYQRYLRIKHYATPNQDSQCRTG
ncbi:hypothetical protein TNCV_1518951 [Trichonephila clavipes]|nr:hypothetical protein TNCV_1518951 [Trichonephila clavipes]